MSPFDVARWRPAPYLPVKETRDGALVFVVAVLCYPAARSAAITARPVMQAR